MLGDDDRARAVRVPYRRRVLLRGTRRHHFALVTLPSRAAAEPMTAGARAV
jgi:hypothetical protein